MLSDAFQTWKRGGVGGLGLQAELFLQPHPRKQTRWSPVICNLTSLRIPGASRLSPLLHQMWPLPAN